MAVKNCFIRGSVVRYVQIPSEHVDTQLLEDATRRGTFTTSLFFLLHFWFYPILCHLIQRRWLRWSGDHLYTRIMIWSLVVMSVHLYLFSWVLKSPCKWLWRAWLYKSELQGTVFQYAAWGSKTLYSRASMDALFTLPFLSSTMTLLLVSVNAHHARVSL